MTSRLAGSWGSRIRCRAGAATWRRGNHTFVNALPWMCRAEAPWRGLPECCGKWVTVYRRFDRWPGDGAMERLFTAWREERVIGAEIRVLAMDSTSAEVHRHAAGAPRKGGGSRSVGVSPGGAEHGRTRFNRMKRYRKAATHYGRLDEAFLADLRLILIAIYLKNTAKNQLA